MLNSRVLRLCFGLWVALLMILGSQATAYADHPDDAPRKGTVPASAPILDTAACEDASAYEPVPVNVRTMKIGLCYEDGAVYEASFVNPAGSSFLIGEYDEQRQFQKTDEIPCAAVSVRPLFRWHLLYDRSFTTKRSAEKFAKENYGLVIRQDGVYRVIMGSYDSVGEVNYLIGHDGYKGTAWKDSGFGIFDSQGRLVYLTEKADELALITDQGEQGITSFRGERYRGGFILKQSDFYRVTVINVVELEDYVKGVIPYEMSPSWPFEALKAQAVCARSFAAYNIELYGDQGFDLTADTESQVYRGLNGADAVTDSAVEATTGQYVRYRGELCEIYYFASDGGATESGKNVFGSDCPYLSGKTDPFEEAVDFAVRPWERWLSGEEIAYRLHGKGYAIGTVVEVVPVYSELGNVIGMSYRDADGTVVSLANRDSYSLLGMSNCRFTVMARDDGFVFAGKGWGHNCGMSQWGANAMASAYGYTCEEIIGFYFTGAYVG